MNRPALFALCLLLAATPALAAHRPHRRHAPRAAPSVTSAEPDCRYPDGTPFDPDIIGGANHVGDGGPAVNLGGYAPCGY